MKAMRVVLALVLVSAVALTAVPTPPAGAQGQTIKIGVLYDHTGPFSAAGSLNCWRGAKMLIDYVNERGGVLGKYKIVQVDGDSQSKAEVAINEAERLLNDGDTTIGGRVPVNPSGGLACFGEAVPAQAIAQVCELTWQLRGQAGDRQVDGATAGITVNQGLFGHGSSVIAVI